jgi:acyl carrier protein
MTQTPLPADGFTLVRQALTKYTDTPAAQIELTTALADIDIDSLTLAELLFELEDRLGVSIAETSTLPTLVSELVTLVEPYLGATGVDPKTSP